MAKNLDEFRRDCVDAHNCFRSRHRVPEVRAAEDLMEAAQSWAQQIALRGCLQYCEAQDYGENISVLVLNGEPANGKEIIAHWYNELVNYDFNKPGWQKGTSNATQLLWRSSTHLGIGIAKSKDKVFVVAFYRPSGNSNSPGEFEQNVFPDPNQSKRSFVAVNGH